MNFLKNISNEYVSENERKKFQLALKIISVAVVLTIVSFSIYLYFKYGKVFYNYIKNPQDFKNFLKSFNNYDKLVFVAIRAIQTVVKIVPAEPLEIGSGILYGTFGGLFYCMIGTFFGSLVIIAISKIFGERIVSLFVPIEKINSIKFLKDKKKVYLSLFFIYLIPGTPKDIITYIASVTSMSMPKFLLVTSIARIPSIITSTWCGQEVFEKNFKIAIIIFAVTAFLSVVCSAVYKAYSDRKNNEREE